MEKLREILIIEDNPLDAALLQEYFTLAGIEADKISHAEKLKQLISFDTENQPDLIFLDLNLPDSNGLGTFLSVNGIFPHVPIIILSGQSDTEVALQAIQAGAQDYLLKGDFDEKFFLKIVKYSIERKRTQIKLEESNKRYEVISKATNDPVWDWDMVSNRVFWNDKVNIFGYPEEMKKDYSWWWANIHPNDIDRINEKIDSTLKDGKEQWSDYYRFRCADGNYSYIFDRRYILKDSNGKPCRMISVLQDITDQVMYQQKLDEEKEIQQKAILQATVEGQEKERSMIGKELHDNINQILASVKLMITASMTKSGNQDPYLLESIKLTDECINEIRRLSNSLVPIREQEIDLKQAIAAVIGRLKATSDLKFNISFPDCLAKKLNDEQELTIYRIVQEQINNIIKHAEAKTVSISLEEEDENVLLRVTDDGKGFDTAARADGIGLKNMKSRSELLSGKFCIESEPGNGCTISVKIPLHLN